MADSDPSSGSSLGEPRRRRAFKTRGPAATELGEQGTEGEEGEEGRRGWVICGTISNMAANVEAALTLLSGGGAQGRALAEALSVVADAVRQGTRP